jgi:hypothetical protein
MGRGDPFREANNVSTHPQMAKNNFLLLVGNPDNDPAKGWTADLSWDLMARLGMDPTNTPPETLFNYLGQHRLGFRIMIQNGVAGSTAPFWGSAVDNGLMPFAPHYDNTPGRRVLDSIGLRSAVSGGGGVTGNLYSYGPGLELFDALPLWVSRTTAEDAAQSWANQVVAAKFARILDAHPDYNIWDARQHLRQAASFWTNGWAEKNGYGRVDETAVVGRLLPGPPVEFRAERSRERRKVLFTWRNFLQSDFAATVIARQDGRILYEGAGTNFTWTSDVDGDETFTFWSKNKAGEKSRPESYQTRTVTGLLGHLNPTCLILGARSSQDELNPRLKSAFDRAAPGWGCDVVYRTGSKPVDSSTSALPAFAVARLPDLPLMVDYAISNHYQILVAPASYPTDPEPFEFKPLWDRATAQGILVVVGHNLEIPARLIGTNLLRPTRLYSAVTVGCDASARLRSAGPGLEFSAPPPPQTFVLAYRWPSVVAADVAGKLARILEANPDYNLWDARQHLRQSASHYARGWSEDGGYGRPPDEPAKLASLDPAPPLDIQAVRSDDGKSVAFSWQNFLQSSFAETVIERKDGRAIYHGTGTNCVWRSDVDGEETFTFRSKDKAGRLSKAERFAVFRITGLARQ